MNSKLCKNCGHIQSSHAKKSSANRYRNTKLKYVYCLFPNCLCKEFK